MTFSAELAAATGSYLGTGDGVESGPFKARIDISLLPNGGVLLVYEATAPNGETLHQESTMLTAGPDGRDVLHIAHSESPFVARMVEAASGRFQQPEPFGPYALEVAIERPEPGHLTYAWLWAPQGEEPTEQTKADVRLATSSPSTV